METTKLSRLVGGRPFEETLQFVDSEFDGKNQVNLTQEKFFDFLIGVGGISRLNRVLRYH